MRPRAQLRQREQGYSFFEMLFAFAVGALGIVAIFALQFSNIRGNNEARELSAALNLAERVVAHLQTDSTQWFNLQLPPPRLSRASARWYSLTPNPVDHNLRPHVSVNREQGTALQRQRFCAHYWLDALDGPWGGLINGRARVVWSRDVTSGTEQISALCNDDAAEAFREDPVNWRSITLPFVLRRHPR
ncbi:MAG: hypothetical protein VYD19_01195 [Myxococcota bacterium]|nr:hypothetical protein [Myxococcota bacterium]